MSVKQTGYLVDPPDSRDWKYSGIAPVRADGDHTIEFDIPVREQVGGSCVANAWCNALEILMVREGLLYRRLADHALYWQARNALGNQGKDEGTHIRIGANVLANQGVGLDADWPASYDTLFTKPWSKYWPRAFDAQLAAFYRVENGDLPAIENAVRANHPVVIGVQVGQSFMQYDGQPNVVFDKPSNSLGGHAMTVIGVRGSDWLLLNSWSSSWGMNGRVWVSSEYMRSASDIWVGTRHPL